MAERGAGKAATAATLRGALGRLLQVPVAQGIAQRSKAFPKALVECSTAPGSQIPSMSLLVIDSSAGISCRKNGSANFFVGLIGKTRA